MAKKCLDVPLLQDLINPTIKALKELGGSGTVDEIQEKVIEILNLPDRVIELLHRENGETEISYRLAWARTCLKKVGILENSQRRVWTISQVAKNIDEVNAKEIINKAKSLPRGLVSPDTSGFTNNNAQDFIVEKSEEVGDWKEKLYEILMSMDPSAFERLAQ